jgi:hypothetical protein
MGVIVWVCAFAALLAQAQAAPEPSGVAGSDPTAPEPVEESDAAEVAIVDGNVVGAKKRALEEAFLRAVDRVYSAELLDAGLSSTTPPVELQKFRATFATTARRYVRSYRVVQESESNGKLLIRVVAAVDRVFLRRQIEKSRAGTSVSNSETQRPIEIAVTEGPAELGAAVSGALRSSGLSVQVVPFSPAAAPGSSRITLKSAVHRQGDVRGTGLLATQCQLDAALLKADGTNGIVVPTSLEWGFGTQPAAADKACLDRLAALAARHVANSLSDSLSPTSRKFVTAILDIVEPVALERFLQKLPRLGTVSRFELRRITVGVAEVRMETNLTAAALGAALAQSMAEHLTMSTTQSSVDSVHLTLRVRTDAEASPTFEEESAEGQ